MRSDTNIRRLLIVDDEENILRAFQRQFGNLGFQIHAIGSAEEALELLNRYEFPLVLSDYRMPEMNGVEFLTEVQRLSPDSIRIIFTGCADINMAMAAINEGHVYKFITKPWEEESLQVHIRRAFEYYDLLQERKILREQLEAKNRELEEINRNLERRVEERTQQLIHAERLATLGQIAGQIGHEINNSITIMNGRMGIFLKKRNEDAEAAENSLASVVNEIERLKNYGRNLLTLGRPTPVEMRELNILSLLDGTIENLRFAGVLKFYTISRKYSSDRFVVHGDGSQIEQVFTNILINAHHAMGGKGRLTLAASVSSCGRFIEIGISDTGAGIPEEMLDRIFDAFYTTKGEGQGTGLGLSVVRKIMDFHKGYIRVRSEVSQGTTMTLGFPVS